MNGDRENIYEILVDIKNILREINEATQQLARKLPMPIEPEDWVEKVTPEDVEVEPGEEKDILEVTDSGYLWEVGCNDETYTTYYLIVDDTEVGEPLPQPWGLYNDPYRFPQPIEFGSSVVIRVERHEDAPAPAKYYGKARYVKR